MTEFHELSALEALAKIKSGDLTAEALMRSCFERIDERDELVGAWSYFDKDRVISEAIKSDKAGNPGPLGGLPVAVKDIMDTVDMPTTYGSSIYGNHQPSEDADCVKNVRTNGGIIIGKTVTTEFAGVTQEKQEILIIQNIRLVGRLVGQQLASLTCKFH